MGRLRKIAGRLRRMARAALGSEDAKAVAEKPRAAAHPAIATLGNLILDGDYAAFRSAWADAAGEAANDPAIGAPADQLHLVRAEAELSFGDHESLRATARKLIDDYRSPLGYYHLARSHFLRAEYRHCIESLHACLYSMPNHGDATFLLADAAALSGERELAWRTLEQFARRSKRPRTWLLMANLVQSHADYSRLLDNWRQARAGAMVAALDVSINEYLALGALRCGNYTLARQVWRTTLLGLAANPGKLKAARPKTVNYSGQRAETALIDLNRVLSEAGIPMFLVSGTLLGCVREGRLLGHDKDIDVGIWDDVPAERLHEVLRGSGLFVVLASRSPEIVRLRHANGISADVFFHYREPNDYWHGGVKMRWHNKPFKLVPREFLDNRFLIPEDFDTYLVENYGNWQEPKIDFDSAFDTPNGEPSNADELAIHSFKMLTDSLVKGDAAKVAFYLDKLEASGEGPFVRDFNQRTADS